MVRDHGVARTIGLILSLAALSFPAAGTASAECTCRNKGVDYKVGELACIRGKLARCDMALNNTSWIVVSDGCPAAREPGLPEILISATLAPTPTLVAETSH